MVQFSSLLTPRLELGGLMGVGTFSTGSAEIMAGISPISLLGLLVTMLVAMIAVHLSLFLTAFTRR